MKFKKALADAEQKIREIDRRVVEDNARAKIFETKRPPLQNDALKRIDAKAN